jgi:hypothetical protein
MMAKLARCAVIVLLVCAAAQARGQGFTQGGLTGSYFANATLSGTPSFSRRDVRVRFNWAGLPPGGSTTPSFTAVPAAGFSARWTGTIVAPSTGLFTFTTTTSGPTRLWLTSPTGTASEIIAYAGHGRATVTGQYRLSAGKLYGVKMEFQDMAQPAVAELDWAGPGLARQAIEPAVPLGVNMTSIADWDGSRVFADTIKQSRGWAEPDNFAVPVAADAQGWPTQDFLVIPIAGPPELNGAYALRFQGLAQVQLMFGYGTFSVGLRNYGGTLPSGAGYDAATNTTTATMNVTPANGINMFVSFTNTKRSRTAKLGTGLTGLQLMRPTAPGADIAYSFQELFNGGLKSALAPFSTVRYMEYLDTNGTTVARWSDRVVPSLPVQAGAEGGALEYAVMLANETGKDLWINVPVSADDTYVQNLARLLRYGSDGVMPYTSPQLHPVFPPVQPNLNVYVEYSNEVWNFSFGQASTNLKLAEAEVAAGSPLNFDGETNIYYWGWRRVALRIAQISNLFRSVWGNAAMGTVIRPVLEWQGGDGQATADEQLNFLDDYFNNADGLRHVAIPRPPSYYLWGAGAGWYHTVNDPGAATVDAIYKSGLILPTAVATDAAWAHSFGLKETGYEGGFEIGDDGPDPLQLAADLDPRAKGFEAAGLKSYFAQGGGLGMIYNIAGASAYGLADPTIYDTATPKLAAVNALVAAAPPKATLGTVVTGAISLPTTSADIAHDIWGTFGSTVNVGSGNWLNWTVNVATPGNYAISTNLGPAAGQTIVVDGMTIGNSGATAMLTSGLHGIHVRNLGSGSLALTALKLAPVVVTSR